MNFSMSIYSGFCSQTVVPLLLDKRTGSHNLPKYPSEVFCARRIDDLQSKGIIGDIFGDRALNRLPWKGAASLMLTALCVRSLCECPGQLRPDYSIVDTNVVDHAAEVGSGHRHCSAAYDKALV